MRRRRVAVVGGGIAGCGAAWSLSDHHEVTLFEGCARLGGHADGVDVATPSGPVRIDVGVMGLHKGHTSPTLGALLDLLGVSTVDVDLTCGTDLGPGLTWTNLDHAPGARERLAPEIARLQALVAGITERPVEEMAAISVRDFLRSARLSPELGDLVVDPLLRTVFFNADPLGFALAVLILAVDEGFVAIGERPVYRRIVGGTGRLFDELAGRLGRRVHLGSAVTSVARRGAESVVQLASGEEAAFDEVVLAIPAESALALLRDASDEELTVLEGLRGEALEVVLHDDASVWGRHLDGEAPVLQVVQPPGGLRRSHFDVRAWHALPLERPAIMTRGSIDVAPDRVIARRSWRVGAMTPMALYRRSLLPAIQGTRGRWFCGQSFTLPSQEETFISGLLVAAKLGAPLPFRSDPDVVVLQGFVQRLMGESGPR